MKVTRKKNVTTIDFTSLFITKDSSDVQQIQNIKENVFQVFQYYSTGIATFFGCFCMFLCILCICIKTIILFSLKYSLNCQNYQIIGKISNQRALINIIYKRNENPISISFYSFVQEILLVLYFRYESSLNAMNRFVAIQKNLRKSFKIKLQVEKLKKKPRIKKTRKYLEDKPNEESEAIFQEMRMNLQKEKQEQIQKWFDLLQINQNNERFGVRKFGVKKRNEIDEVPHSEVPHSTLHSISDSTCNSVNLYYSISTEKNFEKFTIRNVDFYLIAALSKGKIWIAYHSEIPENQRLTQYVPFLSHKGIGGKCGIKKLINSPVYELVNPNCDARPLSLKYSMKTLHLNSFLNTNKNLLINYITEYDVLFYFTMTFEHQKIKKLFT